MYSSRYYFQVNQIFEPRKDSELNRAVRFRYFLDHRPAMKDARRNPDSNHSVTAEFVRESSCDLLNEFKEGFGTSTPDEGILTAQAKKFNDDSRNKRSAQKLARNKKTIRTLVESVENNPRFGKLIEYSVDCLANLVIDDVSAEELVDSGVIEMLLRVLETNPYNEKVMRVGAKLITALSRDSRVGERVVGRLTFSLDRHVEENTIVNVCEALVAIMKQDKTGGIVNSFLMAEGEDSLERISDEWSENIEVSRAVTSVLLEITNSGRKMSQIMSEWTVQSLDMHLYDMTLAINSMDVLRNVVAHDLSKRAWLKSTGILEIAVLVMDTHHEDPKVLKSGVDLLHLVSGDSDILKALGVVKGIAELKGIGSSVSTLANLSLVPGNAKYIIENSGSQILVDCLRKCVDMHEVDFSLACSTAEGAARAIGRLAAADLILVNDLLQAGAMEAIQSATIVFGREAGACGELIEACAHICNTEEQCLNLAAAGGLKSVFEHMTLHSNNYRVAKAGFKFILSMAKFQSTNYEICKAKVFNPLLSSIEACVADADVVDLGITCLKHMLKHSMTAKIMSKVMVHSEGLEVLQLALLEHKDVVELMIKILGVVESLCKEEEFVERMKHASMLESIVIIMAAHTNVYELQHLGSRIVSFMADKKDIMDVVGSVSVLNARVEHLKGDAQAKQAEALAKKLSLLSDLSNNLEKFELIVEAGGRDAVLKSFVMGSRMPASESRDKLLSAALIAVSCLSCDDSISGTLVDGPYFDAILHCSLKSQSHNEKFAEKTMILSAELSSNNSIQDFMIERKHPRMLVEISDMFPENDKIHRNLISTMENLVSSHPEILPSLLEMGVASSIIDAISIVGDDTVDPRQEVRLLGKLSACEDFSGVVIQNGGFDSCMYLMKIHEDDPEMSTEILTSLCKITKDTEFVKKIDDRYVIATVSHVLQRFPDVEELQVLGLQFLTDVMICDFMAKSLFETDHASIIDSAVERFSENVQIQELGPSLFESMGMLALGDSMPQVVEDEVLGTSIQRIRVLMRSKKKFVTSIDMIDEVDCILSEHQRSPSIVLATVHAFGELFAESQELSQLEYIVEVSKLLHELLRDVIDLGSEEEIISILRNLVHVCKVKSARRKLLKEGLLVDLFAIFSGYEDNADVLTELVKVFAVLANNRHFIERLMTDNSVRILIEAMCRHVESERFEKNAMKLIGALAPHESSREEIIFWSGIEVIGKIMHRWMASRGVISNANYALANLAFNSDEAQDRIASTSSLKMVIRGLETHTKYPNLCKSAASVLATISYGSIDRKEKLAFFGSTRALVDVVLRNMSRVDLVTLCYRAMGNIAFHIPNIPIVVSEGAVQSIVAGITLHVGNIDLIQVALNVLTNLAADSSEVLQSVIAEEGAVQAIVDISGTHVSNPDVEAAAISTLINLAEYRSNAEMIIKQGGLEGVCTAMVNFEIDEELVERGARLLYKLSQTRGVSRRFITTPRVIESICLTLDSLGHNSGIRTHLVRALYELCSKPAAATDIGRRGGVDCILDTIEAHLNDLEALKESLRTLSALAKSEWCATQMLRRSLEYTKMALRQHYKDSKLCEIALGFIGNLCAFDLPSSHAADSGIIILILKATRDQLHEKQVIILGLRCIEYMAYGGDTNREILREAGANLSIEVFHRQWNYDEEVDHACTKAADALIGKATRIGYQEAAETILARLGKEKTGSALPEYIRNMLVSGKLFRKHSNNAKPRPRHVFVSHDLSKLCWKDPKKPMDSAKSIDISAIKVIGGGCRTYQLRRKSAFGKPYAKDEHSFACLTADRNISLEANNEEEREEWIEALKALKQYNHDKLFTHHNLQQNQNNS